MPFDYETEYKKQFQLNRKDTVRAVKEGNLDTRIDNFCALHGFDRQYVITQIEENDVVRALFAIDPKRQNFYETKAADYISEMEGVTEFSNLPNNDLVVSNGAVLKKKDLQKAGGVSRSKTIDFRWKYNGYLFYASHKYTKESGGSQGNQYKDLQSFIKEASDSTLNKTYFIAIADGEFYQTPNGEARVTKIERLRQLASTDKVFACTMVELEALMKKITEGN